LVKDYIEIGIVRGVKEINLFYLNPPFPKYYMPSPALRISKLKGYITTAFLYITILLRLNSIIKQTVLSLNNVGTLLDLH
jgi:hypothetical protein